MDAQQSSAANYHLATIYSVADILFQLTLMHAKKAIMRRVTNGLLSNSDLAGVLIDFFRFSMSGLLSDKSAYSNVNLSLITVQIVNPRQTVESFDSNHSIRMAGYLTN